MSVTFNNNKQLGILESLYHKYNVTPNKDYPPPIFLNE